MGFSCAFASGCDVPLTPPTLAVGCIVDARRRFSEFPPPENLTFLASVWLFELWFRGSKAEVVGAPAIVSSLGLDSSSTSSGLPNRARMSSACPPLVFDDLDGLLFVPPALVLLALMFDASCIGERGGIWWFKSMYVWE